MSEVTHQTQFVLMNNNNKTKCNDVVDQPCMSHGVKLVGIYKICIVQKRLRRSDYNLYQTRPNKAKYEDKCFLNDAMMTPSPSFERDLNMQTKIKDCI